MNINQVAVQLYTLRDSLQLAGEIKESLKKVAAIGYKTVELGGFLPIPDGELLAILAGEGLRICSAHEDGQTILSEPEKVAARMQRLNCDHAVYPYPSGVDFSDAAQVEQLARQLDHAGKVLREAGKGLAYHNHGIELLRLGNRTVLDYLYDQADKHHLQAEIDTYWIQYGGGDPVAWCEKLKGRLPLLHMKDYQFTVAGQPAFAEIGQGNLDWKKIIAAAEGSGCEWFIVEQDVCPGDPFESIKKSFDYIEAHLC